MNIEELLTRYTDIVHKRDEAFDTRIDNLVYDNKVPVELKDIDGNLVGFTILTPDDLWKARSGMVIAVCGSEWLRCEDKWVSCYDTGMFIHILRNLNWTHLVRRGY